MSTAIRMPPAAINQFGTANCFRFAKYSHVLAFQADLDQAADGFRSPRVPVTFMATKMPEVNSGDTIRPQKTNATSTIPLVTSTSFDDSAGRRAALREYRSSLGV